METLYFIEMDEIINFDSYKNLLDTLPYEKQVHIKKYRFDMDKKLSFFSDLFVRYLACRFLRKENSYLFFCKNKYGKPFIEGISNFHYNISHTRNAIVIGVSQEPIGVDVEKSKSFDLEIAKRYFGTEELKYIMKDDGTDSNKFYEVWTKKEAYIKWIGKGLSLPLTSFDVVGDELDCKLVTMQINEYLVSVCGNKEINLNNIITIDERFAYEVLKIYFG